MAEVRVVPAIQRTSSELGNDLRDGVVIRLADAETEVHIFGNILDIKLKSFHEMKGDIGMANQCNKKMPI